MLEWVISSGVLIALIIALRFFLKGKISLRLQYTLWALVLLRLLVPVSFGSSGLSVMNAVERAAVDTSSFTSAAVRYVGGDTSALAVAELAPNAGMEEQAAQYEANRQEWQAEMDAARAETGITITVADILRYIWLSGAAVIALWLLASNLRLALKLKKSRRSIEVEGCQLPVYMSDEVDTPCLFGLLRPAIYMTTEATESATTLRHSIEHETTHYRHGDHIWSLLRGACLALHWYNPLVWWAAVLSRNDAELACDEATIKRIGENERAEYGRTLIGLTCEKRPALLITATTMTGSGRSIKERIKLIAKKPRMAAYTLIAVLLIAAVAAGCTFTGANDNPYALTSKLSIDEITSVSIWGDGGSASCQRMK